jgi:hypothetical protein
MNLESCNNDNDDDYEIMMMMILDLRYMTKYHLSP